MVRMTFNAAAIATILAMSSSVHAQQVRPEDSLHEATELVGGLTVPSTGGEQIAALKRDFTDFASSYLGARDQAPSATAGAVGTSGRSEPRADWRAKYERVEADLASLLGQPGSQAPASARLDSDTRTRLENLRARLRTFYAATLGEPDGNPVAHTGASPTRAGAAAQQNPIAPTAQAPQTERSDSPAAGASAVAAPVAGDIVAQIDTSFGTELALLDRMQRILDAAVKDPGKLSIDRASIDEMRAEVAQIRAALQSRPKD